ncbi:Uu.00g123190.m01.CDS01 [Anthostomella pinea]|uniref:Uu.00g123190.m01.CDS01 n=1 Tax=Anthostomella pinea TaxID=933095 RepID=A0AAI8VHC5_9PEZI|nr:Uu.00g123190.m01.CDS01 [Anthostomella pinea]
MAIFAALVWLVWHYRKRALVAQEDHERRIIPDEKGFQKAELDGSATRVASWKKPFEVLHLSRVRHELSADTTKPSSPAELPGDLDFPR